MKDEEDHGGGGGGDPQGQHEEGAVCEDVTIRDGERAIATVTLSGRYNAEQALREFKKNPGKFKPFAGWTVEAVATYAMAA